MLTRAIHKYFRFQLRSQVKKLTMIAKANERQRQKYIDNEKEVEVEMSNASKMIEKAT